MSQLVLLTARDCPLCARARQVLEALVSEGLLSWREVHADCTEGRRLSATTPPLRPVLLDPAGRVLAYGRLSENRLRRELERDRESSRERDLRSGIGVCTGFTKSANALHRSFTAGFESSSGKEKV